MAKRSFLPTLFKSGGQLQQREEAIGHVLSGTPVWDGVGNMYSDFDGSGWDFESANRRGLERNIWVFRCVDVIATAQARTPMLFRKGDAHTGEELEDEDTKRILRLLNQRPNSYEDAFMFRYRLSAQLLLSKRGAFIEPVFDNVGRVAELHLIPPDVVTPIPSEKTFIRGYQIEGKYRWGLDEVPPDKLIWVRLRPHPQKPYEQMTPLMTAELSIDTDYMARLYNRNYLGNGGKNGLLVMVQGLLGMTDAEEMRMRFRGGPGQAGQPTVIEAQGVTVQDLGSTPRDAQWLEAIAGAKKEILEAFGVPESLIGDASNRTFDNADAEAENFWTNTEMGHCDGIARGLDLLTGAIDDDKFMAYDYSVVDVLQRQKRRKEEKSFQDFTQGAITLDEYREEIGREKLDVPSSRVVYIKAVGAIASGADEDVQAITELTPVGQPPMQDPNMMGGDPALAANDQDALSSYEQDQANQDFGAGGGFGGGAGGGGFGSGQSYQASKFGSGQGGYGGGGSWGTGGGSGYNGSTGSKKDARPPIRTTARVERKSTRGLEPIEDQWLLDIVSKAADRDGYLDPLPIEAKEVGEGDVHPFLHDLDVYEAELGGAIDQWSNTQSTVLPDRVMHVKVRKHTRHWVETGMDGTLAGTKALDPHYIVDVDRWAAGLSDTLRKTIEKMARKEALRAAKDMDVSAFAKMMHTKGVGGDPNGSTHVQRVFGSDSAMEQAISDLADKLETIVQGAAKAQSDRIIKKISAMDANGASAKEIQAEIKAMTGKRTSWQKSLSRFLSTSTVEGIKAKTYGLAGDLLTKTWNTMEDEKVRPAHVAANGQSVPAHDPYTVGGFPMQYPGDPTAPPHLTANCRCWSEYTVADKYGSFFDDIAGTSGAAKS